MFDSKAEPAGDAGQDHHRHELGRYRRADPRHARHQEPDHSARIGPVSFVLPNGTVRANALTFHSAEHTLTFRGKVRVHMVRPGKDTRSRQGRRLPASAATAAEGGQPAKHLPPLPRTRRRKPRRTRNGAAPSVRMDRAPTIMLRALLWPWPRLALAGIVSSCRYHAQTAHQCVRRPVGELERADRHRVGRARGARQGEIRDLQGQCESRAGHDDAPRQGAQRALCRRRQAGPGGAKKERRRERKRHADGQGWPAPQRGASGDGENAQITKIEAKGEVVITSDKDQTTTSDWALYDVPAQLVTVGGNVVLTPRRECAKGGPARHRSENGRKPVRKYGQ